MPVAIFPSKTTSPEQALEIAKNANPKEIVILFTTEENESVHVTHSTMYTRDLIYFGEALKHYSFS